MKAEGWKERKFTKKFTLSPSHVTHLDHVVLGYINEGAAELEDGTSPLPIAGGVPAVNKELLPGNDGDGPAALLPPAPYGGMEDLDKLLTLLL